MAAMLCTAAVAKAGGLMTNTNYHIAFDRMMARGATFDIDAAYSNPAGLVWNQHEGWMLLLVSVGSKLQRTIALRERSRHLLSRSAGIGHEEHEGKFLSCLSDFRDKQVIGHRLACLFIFERQLLELTKSHLFQRHENAVRIFVDLHVAALAMTTFVALLLGTGSKANNSYCHHKHYFSHILLWSVS